MKKLAERLAFLLLNGGKACFYNGEKQKRKVATLEQAGFLIVLKHTPLGFMRSTSLRYVELSFIA